MVNVKLVFILLLAIVCLRQDIFGQLRSNDFIVKHFTTDDGLPSNSIYTCTKDPYGYIWFATENGIARFDGKHFRNFDASHGLLDNMVLGTERIENFIIGYGFKGLTFIQLVNSNNFKFKRRLCITHGRLVATFNNQIFYRINDTLNLISIKDNTEEKISIKDSGRIEEIFKNYAKVFYDFYPNLLHKKEVKNGTLLFKVDNSGNNQQEIIYLYKNGRPLDSIKFSGRLGSILENDSIISIITSNSISSYVIRNDKFSLTQSIDVSDYKPNSCLRIDENTYILSTNDQGFYLFRRKIGLDSLKSKQYVDFSEWLSNHKQTKGVKCYENISPESILVGTHSGVAFFDAKNNTIGSYIFDIRTYSLFAENSNQLYIGTINGLYYFTLSNKISRKINLEAATDAKINSIRKDKNGNLWVSAAGKGIYVLDKNHNIIRRLSAEQGLVTNDIYKIGIDHKDRKWFSSNKGLQILNGENFYRLDKKEGLIADEILDFELEGDTAWISTPIGKQSYVYQDQNMRVDVPLFFNNFGVNNIPLDTLPEELDPSQDKIEFNYIGIFHSSPDNIEYQYKLVRNGKETPWQKTRETKLIFEKLLGGEYELKIKAYHNNYPGIQSKIISKKFFIKPYFYQTIWFYGLLSVFVFAMITYYMYRLNRRKIKSLLYQKELAKLKLEALKAEMNPHFIFNVLNTIKEAMMEGDFDTSQNLLSRLAKIIRQALYNAKRDFLSLEEEIDFIEQYVELERERFSKKFDFIKNIDKNLLHYEVPTMLLQPFFENAIRHGKIGQLGYPGKLYFEISETATDLIIIIRDNGVGLEKAKKNKDANQPEHQSMALEIIEERIALFKKTHGIRIKLVLGAAEIDDYMTEVKLWVEKEKTS